MTTFRHGSRVTEKSTSSTTPTLATSTLQVFVGTSPVNLSSSTDNVNKAILAYSYDEAVAALGYSNDFENYTLCEAIDTVFNLYAVAPAIFINVLDPTEHKKDETGTVNIANKTALLNVDGVLLNTVVVKLTEQDATPLISGTDYIATFNKDGKVVIAVIDGGGILTSQATLFVSYTRLDPTLVTEVDIIGGTDITTGDAKGIELINSVFPRFGLNPAQLIIPKYSLIPSVAAVMRAKVTNINTYFRAESITDIDSSEVIVYTGVSEWKNSNNYTSPEEIVCWPKVSLGSKRYNLSTHLSTAIVRTASENGDTPHVSPSNKSLNIDGAVLANGKEVNLGPDEAEYINSQGIVTALNFYAGWKAWGNNTGAFPAGNDIKDIFIPNRLVHNWIANTIVLTTWTDVDDALNRSLIDNVVSKLNIWMNGLTNDGVLLGGRVEYNAANNPNENLLNGKVKFNVYIAAPTPAQDMEFILEVDTTYYNSAINA